MRLDFPDIKAKTTGPTCKICGKEPQTLDSVACVTCIINRGASFFIKDGNLNKDLGIGEA